MKRKIMKTIKKGEMYIKNLKTYFKDQKDKMDLEVLLKEANEKIQEQNNAIMLLNIQLDKNNNILRIERQNKEIKHLREQRNTLREQNKDFRARLKELESKCI